jgi:hypothetical protein
LIPPGLHLTASEQSVALDAVVSRVVQSVLWDFPGIDKFEWWDFEHKTGWFDLPWAVMPRDCDRQRSVVEIVRGVSVFGREFIWL